MEIDHIFIFVNDKGQVADDLVQFGLFEGSSRVHLGQGTSNRKFYFDNFFLEILWVHSKDEILNLKLLDTGLWERAGLGNKNLSPFGLCLVNDSSSDMLFKNAYQYQPDYFPNGKTIEILKNDDNLFLPWTFRLPFKGQKEYPNEPKNHLNGVKRLTHAKFSTGNATNKTFINHFSQEKKISFKNNVHNELHLTFDHNCQKKKVHFSKLNLTIHY